MRQRLNAPFGPLAVPCVLVLAIAIVAGCGIEAPVPGAPGTVTPTRIATPTPTLILTAPTPTPEPTFLVYQVQPKDALEAIARRFRTTIDSIGYWNRERYASLDPDSSAYTPDSIKVGWLLRIHPGQTTDGDFEPPSDGPSTAGSPGASPAASPSASPSS